MPDENDMELLADYGLRGSEAAFAELVRRHISLVYSAAARHVGIAAQAEEITQAVFIILAQKAASLQRGTVLEGWLYETTRLTALRFLRGEHRRQFREQEAYMQSTIPEPADSTWEELSPLLDEAMSQLGRKDRDVVILRFFKEKSVREVAATMRVNEAAAQRRILRALEKLRKIFSKRGMVSTTTIIAGTISANSVQAAPAALAQSVTAVAIAKGATASASTLTLIKGALKFMAWMKVKTAVVAGAAVVLTIGLGTGVCVYHFAHSTKDLAAELRAALRIPHPAGTWQYPSEKVMFALLRFGSNRATAFPILEKALESSNAEARKQAVAAMEFVGAPARPKYDPGEPSPDAVPLLWKILNSNDGELSSFALTSLRGIGFQPNDIPVLAALLVRSHGNQLSPAALGNPSVSQLQNFLSRADNDQMLQRCFPEAIAETIQRNPKAAAPYIPSVEDLLDDANPGVRFGAACALAKCLGVNDPRISSELKAGLKNQAPRQNPDTGLEELMAIETLQHIGPAAEPMVPVLLDYAHSAPDKVLRECALSATGQIDGSLRKTMPEVDQAMENDLTLKNGISPK